MEHRKMSTTAFDIKIADVNHHIQTGRKMRSAEAHKLFAKLIRGLFIPLSIFKTRYVLALTRTA